MNESASSDMNIKHISENQNKDIVGEKQLWIIITLNFYKPAGLYFLLFSNYTSILLLKTLVVLLSDL